MLLLRNDTASVMTLQKQVTLTSNVVLQSDMICPSAGSELSPVLIPDLVLLIINSDGEPYLCQCASL